MMSAEHFSLPAPIQPGIMSARVKSVIFLALYLLAGGALAQQQAQPSPENKRDDLDVTMQIIVDPDAKLPDEVVRRIPLPARKPEPSVGNQPAKSDSGAEEKERAREAKELGREMADSAKQSAKEAAEQREQARRSAAEEKKQRNPEPPRGPPPRP